jgi:hypothetical protein
MLDRNAERGFRRERGLHRDLMKALTSSLSLTVILLWTAVPPANAQVNVTQKNNNLPGTVSISMPRSRRVTQPISFAT